MHEFGFDDLVEHGQKRERQQMSPPITTVPEPPGFRELVVKVLAKKPRSWHCYNSIFALHLHFDALGQPFDLLRFPDDFK